MATNTSTTTTNYGLSQYGANDPVKFLTNYNSDMTAIDVAIKAAKDSAELCPTSESGSWTPTLYGDSTAGSPTYTSQSGNYYKIGKLVIISGTMHLSAKGGISGYVYMGGIPFSAIAGNIILGWMFNDNSPITVGMISGTAISLQKDAFPVADSVLTDTTQFEFSGIYFTA